MASEERDDVVGYRRRGDIAECVWERRRRGGGEGINDQ